MYLALIFLESAIKIAGKGGKKSDKAKSDKPSTAKSGQKSDKKVSHTLDFKNRPLRIMIRMTFDLQDSAEYPDEGEMLWYFYRINVYA